MPDNELTMVSRLRNAPEEDSQHPHATRDTVTMFEEGFLEGLIQGMSCLQRKWVRGPIRLYRILSQIIVQCDQLSSRGHIRRRFPGLLPLGNCLFLSECFNAKDHLGSF